MKMNHHRGLLNVMLFGSCAILGLPQVAHAANADSSDQIEGIIVKYRTSNRANTLSASALALRAQALNVVGQNHGLVMRVARSTALGSQVVKLGKNVSQSEALAIASELQKNDASIEYAEPDQRIYPAAAPNDSRYKEQWDLTDSVGGIRADTAWPLSTGAGVVVAVIDTGYRPHKDLTGKYVAGYDFVSNTFTANDGDGRDADPSDPGDWVSANACYSGSSASDSTWHGTHVAGTIAAIANNSYGTVGVAYDAKIQPVRVLGRCGGLMSDFADGLIWASGGTVQGVTSNPKPARVANMSLEGSGTCSNTMQGAINSALSRNTVVVVAAGNGNTDPVNTQPANCNGVITVGATTRYGKRAPYSNYGKAVTLSAPGGDESSTYHDGILSTANEGASTPGNSGDWFTFKQGTSMAAPHVAGVAALMLAKKPSLTPAQVKNILTSTARPFASTCTGCGAGILDATAALKAIP